MVRKMSSVVTVSWLRNWLIGRSHPKSIMSPPLRILDASTTVDPNTKGYQDFYKESHIPRAAYFDLQGLCPPVAGSRHKYPVPELERFQDYAQSLGINNDTHIVTYDRSNTIFAFKTWWLFRLFGHEQVSVLDGGFQKWLKEGYEVTTEEPTVQRGTFKAEWNPSLISSFRDVDKAIKLGGQQIIDTRPQASFFNDKASLQPGQYGGHMPGAKNIPYPELFQEDGTLKPTDQLKAVLSEAGVDVDKPMVLTCQRALTACGLAAVVHMLGKEDVPVYNGSFREWGQKAPPEHIVSK